MLEPSPSAILRAEIYRCAYDFGLVRTYLEGNAFQVGIYDRSIAFNQVSVRYRLLPTATLETIWMLPRIFVAA